MQSTKGNSLTFMIMNLKSQRHLHCCQFWMWCEYLTCGFNHSWKIMWAASSKT